MPARLKRVFLFAALSGALILFGVIVFLLIRKYAMVPKPDQPTPAAATSSAAAASSSQPVLPDFSRLDDAAISAASSTYSDLAVEYLAFENFYQKPEAGFTAKIAEYEQPLNVKIDVMNYYDVSRKLVLDPALDSLNENSFGTIANPWPQDAPDFYSLYSNLMSRQLPLMITSDFLIYHEQNIQKKLFKDTEENVFYDNIWDINKELYAVAKARYEARLAAIGDVNDSILEGERLETAYFAVALELLKPAPEQTARRGAPDKGVFTAEEASRFYFVVPPYLRDDVLAEVKLIREAKGRTKSPVLLYPRNYTDFVVPSDYLENAKLNNFYLATRWFNSVFPLNYKTKDCPDCLLDKADWRINLTAAALISNDFSNLPDLKGKWARIYKVMSFFKGLREDLSYVHYRDSLSGLFGEKYDLETLFGDKNKQALANLEKLRAKLQTYDFPEISGGLPKADPATKSKSGFKLLAETFWPNNYIFGRLTSPAVGSYTATSTQAGNVTACLDKKISANLRCNGVALDVVNLVYPVGSSGYFTENTSYAGYAPAAQKLRDELQKNSVWHLSNYWLTLDLIRAYAGADQKNLPIFARSAAWQDKVLTTAAGAWINSQLPLEKYTAAPVSKESGLDNFSRWSENSYVEPDLALVDELLADNSMLLKMFSALQLEADVRLALQDLKNYSDDLSVFRAIVTKELSGGKLSAADNEAIADFVAQFKIPPFAPASKQTAVKLPNQKTVLREDLSRFKLLVLVHEEDNSKIFSVGPIWDYQESR